MVLIGIAAIIIAALIVAVGAYFAFSDSDIGRLVPGGIAVVGALCAVVLIVDASHRDVDRKITAVEAEAHALIAGPVCIFHMRGGSHSDLPLTIIPIAGGNAIDAPLADGLESPEGAVNVVKVNIPSKTDLMWGLSTTVTIETIEPVPYYDEICDTLQNPRVVN